MLGENADIIAAENECRCIGAQTPWECPCEPKRRATCWARYMRAREDAMAALSEVVCSSCVSWRVVVRRKAREKAATTGTEPPWRKRRSRRRRL